MKLPPWGTLLPGRRPAGLALHGPSALAGGALLTVSRTPVEPLSLARWLSVRPRGAAASPVAPKKAAQAHRPPAVLVKVGDAGLYSLVKLPEGLGMDRLSLLEALASSKGFAVKLRDVALDEGAVHVCTSASEEAPSAAEAGAASALVGIKTLGTLAASMPAAQPGAHLFVHVALPPPAASATNNSPVLGGALCELHGPVVARVRSAVR
jgi:hypothetical protein